MADPPFPAPWKAVAFLVPVGLLVLLLLLLPRGGILRLSTWPPLAWLYTQALVSASTKSKTSKKGSAPALPGGKAIEVSLSRPVHLTPTRLRAYLALAGFAGGTAGAVPLLYPAVEAFRLAMQAMLLPAFPFNVLGSVLARTRVVALRRVAADEKLLFSCRVDPRLRTTAKGDTEVDLVIEARAAAGAPGQGQAKDGAGGASAALLVWRCTTTAIILSPRRRKGPAPASPQPAQPPAGSETAAVIAAQPDASWLDSLALVDTWQLGSDVGRRYGLLNGDLNPIHLHAVTARLFGFRRPIAHALFLTGRAEAALRNAGLAPHYPCALTAEFKRPTLLPAVLHCGWEEEAAADPAARLATPGGVRFAVVTEDRAKQVIVGSLTAHAPTVAAMLGEQ